MEWILPFMLLGWMQPGVRTFSGTNPLDDPVECFTGVLQGITGCFIALVCMMALMGVAIVVLLGVIAFK